MAAAELTSQQVAIDSLQGQIEASHGDEHASLMTEMNGLLEGKMEAEARAETAEQEAQRLQVRHRTTGSLPTSYPPSHHSLPPQPPPLLCADCHLWHHPPASPSDVIPPIFSPPLNTPLPLPPPPHTHTPYTQLQLSQYDRNAAQEQELIMKAAEAEMDSMRLQLDRTAGQCKSATQEVAVCREREQQLTHRCAQLERSLADKEAYLVDLEGDLETLRGEGSVEAVAGVAKERDGAVAEVLTLREALVQMTAIKDQRIAHLEASKLTQEQMDKIKLLKEEHKKSREDVKTMKKQLAQLKKAYDDLKEKTDKVDNTAGESASLAEISAKLESFQGVIKALKEKLRDCSKQLQEYETERGGVMRVLESHGMDTAGLQLQDTSLPEDASVLEQVWWYGLEVLLLAAVAAVCRSSSCCCSVLCPVRCCVMTSVLHTARLSVCSLHHIHSPSYADFDPSHPSPTPSHFHPTPPHPQDLSEAVAQLAHKLSASAGSARATDKIKSLQESLAFAQKDADEAKAMKVALEKRLEATKANARGSRAEAATVSAEVDSLRLDVAKLQADLEIARSKISGSEDAVSSEVQALEEENLDLMQENKELRKV